MNMITTHFSRTWFFWGAVLFPAAVIAGVTQEEANQLGTTLTPFGATIEGNSDGTIPEWTEESVSADEILAEDILFTITHENAEEYAENLTEGQKALLKRYPNAFRMNVYPSHRPHRLPDWINENTRDNAVNAELVDNGNGVASTYGGVAFPIPANGNEVIWNHNLRWQGQAREANWSNFAVYSNGSQSILGNDVVESYPYYRKGGKASYNGMYAYLFQESTAPVRRKGAFLLVHEPANQAENPRAAWQYIPGQRRVRRAPTVAYDSPDTATASMTVTDDTFLFNGAPDRFEWELQGKREIYVPYNEHEFLSAIESGVTPETLFPQGAPNPDYRRWELHRVWVVEATLREGERHVYGKRRFYIDEDSWAVLLAESYDNRGKLWRVNYASTRFYPELPGVATSAFTFQDLLAGEYVVTRYGTPDIVDPMSDDFFTPQNLRKKARR